MVRKQPDGNPDFTDATKLIIASRAGYRCSYPKCNRLLIGPGVDSNKFINMGDCGHIFSASPIGPRTSGGLTAEQLASVQNGIFLCKHHHGLVDRRSNSNKHTSDMLIRYKDRHEFNISAEIGEHQYPMNWINAFTVHASTLFNQSLTLALGKVTFVYGKNNTGKSLLVDLIYAALTQQLDARLKRRNFTADCLLEFDNPVLSKIAVSLRHDGLVSYQINGLIEPFLPYHFNVLFLRNELKSGKDDVGRIAMSLRLPRQFVLTHLQNLDLKEGIYAKKVTVEPIRRKPYFIDELAVRTSGSGNFDMPFRSLSDSEQFLTSIDITVALANHLAAYQTVLLLVDWRHLFHLDKTNMSKVLGLLRSKSSMFQSIVVSPHSDLLVDWSGWVIAHLQGQVPYTSISQNTLH